MKLLNILFLLLISASASAQQKAPRQMNYYPDNGDIVCVNGNNRYTRALYGSQTLYRLETSDRPLFATYDKKNNRNISFYIIYKGVKTRLDSTSWCEARYRGGVRSYKLKDEKWNGGEIDFVAIASQSSEAAMFAVDAKGFDSDISLVINCCKTKRKGMHREGDLGMEPRESYDPMPGSPVEDKTILIKRNIGKACFVVENAGVILCDAGKGDASMAFAREKKATEQLTSILHIETPDQYINTLDANLVAASNGLWDGSTWLHGCIGWRMPLAGWRAAYLADVLGWNERAKTHFEAYAKSQVTNVPAIYPHPTQDSAMNLARAQKKWGTQMYSNGYICRNPNNNRQMHHYDMNLNYIDELLWHFCYDADTVMMRRMWPVLTSHLAWEKRNFDPDNDHLYDAYCCIWASDALWYNGGAVTHSSAYNYRGNLLATRMAEILGEDPKPYRTEAEAILKAMNDRLWLSDRGHWAEYQDLMGYKRKHESAALWSIYTPIDCGVTTDEQAWLSTQYVIDNIPHIPVTADSGMVVGHTISTTDWMPYDWSINNVAHEEVMDMALAFFQAGRNEEGFALLKSDVLDGMFLGASPGNFGQISYYDKARSEAYRDFGDNVGISSRAIVNGLFGIRPDAMNGRCILQPGFPQMWNSASISTPYIIYRYEKKDGKRKMTITQQFRQPLAMIWRISLGDGQFVEIKGSADKEQTLEVDEAWLMSQKKPFHFVAKKEETHDADYWGLADMTTAKDGKMKEKHLAVPFNSNVDDIFKNKYLSPRAPYTTLQIPVQGIGEWCLPKKTAEINDSAYRATIDNDVFDTKHGVTFASPVKGHNIAYTSLWDNYPDSIDVPAKGKAHQAWLLLAGSTNNMQSRIDNGVVMAIYTDGSSDTLRLRNPENWCPIEQDYYTDGLAFNTVTPRPYRIHLGSGMVSRDLYGDLMNQGVIKKHTRTAEQNIIPNGAAQILNMKLNPTKKLKAFRIKTLSNEVVIGVMAITLE